MSGAGGAQVYTTEGHLVIVMEHMGGRQLAQDLEAHGPMDEPRARELFRQLIEAVGYAHKQACALLLAVHSPALPWKRSLPGTFGTCRRPALESPLPGAGASTDTHGSLCACWPVHRGRGALKGASAAQGVFHRALSSACLMIGSQQGHPMLKVCDFTYSKNALLDSKPQTAVGNFSFTPPELLMAARDEDNTAGKCVPSSLGTWPRVRPAGLVLSQSCPEPA